MLVEKVQELLQDTWATRLAVSTGYWRSHRNGSMHKDPHAANKTQQRMLALRRDDMQNALMSMTNSLNCSS